MAIEKLKGNIKIWENTFSNKGKDIKLYSTTISNKDQDGNFLNASLPVSFSKKVDMSKIVSGCEIELVDAWLTSFPTNRKSQAGNTINNVKLFVNECVIQASKQDEKSIRDEWTKEWATQSKGKTSAQKDALKVKLEKKYQPMIDALEPELFDLPF